VARGGLRWDTSSLVSLLQPGRPAADSSAN